MGSQAFSSPLQQLIVERIVHEGPLTFAEYMRMALYEPGYGYYVSGPSRMGWEGDYFTSSDISQLFAHCLGRQLLQFWEKLKRPHPFRVLEQGAGRGQLSEGIRTWAETESAAFGQALSYQTSDIRYGQNSLVNSAQETFHVLFSNELVDAFPVHLIEVHEGNLYEVYVDVHDNHLNEILAPLSEPELLAVLERAHVPWSTFPTGWRAEINLDAAHWMEQSLQLLRPHGFLLTIDYGDKARKLYIRDRRRGTLLCYYQHQANELPLRLPGEQDITAHVNFSTLIEKGRELGLRLHRYTAQSRWLEDCGLSAELASRRTREFAMADSARGSDQGQVALLGWYNLRQKAAILSDPFGMGNFKVLIMHR